MPAQDNSNSHRSAAPDPGLQAHAGADSLDVEEIDLAADELTLAKIEDHVRAHHFKTEETASNLAEWMIGLFGLSFGVMLLAGVGLLIVAIFVPASDSTTPPSLSLSEIVDSYLLILEAVARVTVTIFGPLLGFILGYYFRRRSRPSRGNTDG